jgi:hypothetical protein
LRTRFVLPESYRNSYLKEEVIPIAVLKREFNVDRILLFCI